MQVNDFQKDMCNDRIVLGRYPGKKGLFVAIREEEGFNRTWVVGGGEKSKSKAHDWKRDDDEQKSL